MTKSNITIYLFSIVFITACQPTNSEEQKEEEGKAKVSQTTENVVSVKLAESKLKSFPLQILATGKVSALTQAKINFKTTGVIEKIMVSNSSVVKSGQVLAVLDNEQQRIALQQAQDNLQDVRVELNKLLLEYGGKDRDTSSVSRRIMENIKAKSGYTKALTSVRDAELKLENTYLKAPYAGVIANLKTKAYNPTPVTEPFCTILSRDALVVEVSVLESELGVITLGQIAKVKSLAYSEKNYIGKVFEINPVVSEQGLVLIKVRIQNPDQYLLEGMNAQVIIEKKLQNQIVVPKEAVVERSGKKVVFTYDNGFAKWNYITVAHENSEEIAISEGLKAGQKVIVEGNLNLGHDAKVIVEK
ncbi:efflux RND transporter periplasmic adaptor subunit [Arcicella aquatica]|uniref:Efflux RND transporter periplasmic adaptor subunit n=1 Tax=Arcicella aquatica TaxID=217141 RepID=A0ABU5QQL7_9BACT|nr:efflux RND transporter periplasmic adaptor subunit [Arcicella aquatica]MEA5259382.1 efflux RND transporter periplasmic adaptor subunit [Arcicella aquatica]